MATIWVSTSGDNRDNGSTYALAKANLYGATGALVAAGIGDTINVVNDGVHAMCGTSVISCRITNEHAGTNWGAGIGLIIRGTDSAGNAAITTIAADSVNRQVFYQNADANYIQYQGLKFDYTAVKDVGAANSLYAITLAANAYNTRVYDCEFVYVNTLDSETSITNTNMVYPIFHTSASVAHTSTIEVAYCLFMHTRLDMAGTNNQSHIVHHNVFVSGATVTPITAQYVQNWGLNFDTVTHRVHHNTFIQRHYATKRAHTCMSNAGNDTAIMAHHSNLFFVECGSTAVTPGLVGQLMSGFSLAAATACITAGYDLLAFGPLISVFEPVWDTQAEGYNSYQYNHIFRTGVSTWLGTDVDPTSLLELDVSYAHVFNGTTSVYTWTPNTYAHNLLADWRPKIGRTTGLGGTVPGALESAINTAPVAFADTYNVTAGNTLTMAAPGVLSNDTNWPVGDPITCVLGTNVTTGTMAVSSDGGFVYTPPIEYSGTQHFHYRVLDSYNEYSNTTTVTIVVAPYPNVPEEEVIEDPSVFIDTLPFFRPILLAHLSAMVRVHRNTNRQHMDMRHYLKNRLHWESTHRVCEVEHGVRKVLTSGGVNRAVGLMLETDTTVNATVVYYNGTTNASFGVTVADCLLIEQANVRYVVVNNTSSTTATVQMVLFD